MTRAYVLDFFTQTKTVELTNSSMIGIMFLNQCVNVFYNVNRLVSRCKI